MYSFYWIDWNGKKPNKSCVSRKKVMCWSRPLLALDKRPSFFESKDWKMVVFSQFHSIPRTTVVCISVNVYLSQLFSITKDSTLLNLWLNLYQNFAKVRDWDFPFVFLYTNYTHNKPYLLSLNHLYLKIWNIIHF